MKGYLEQKGTPTPDKPVEIKSKLIGKNLFETYEVNGRTYTGNLPKNAFISIPNKQYIEYEQQKEEIERLNKRILTLEETIRKANNNVIKDIAMIKTHEMIKEEIVQRLIETSKILESGGNKE